MLYTEYVINQPNIIIYTGVYACGGGGGAVGGGEVGGWVDCAVSHSSFQSWTDTLYTYDPEKYNTWICH